MSASPLVDTPHVLEIGHRFDRPSQPWHQSYPPEVPLGIDIPDWRIEQVLEGAASKFGDRPAVLYFHTRWTYAELLSRVRQVAANLAAHGVGPGDRVLFVLPNCPEFIVAWFAAHWLGAEVVPANPLNTGIELARLARMSGARVAFGVDLRLDAVVEMTREQPIDHLFIVSLARHLPIHLHTAYRVRNWVSRRKPLGNGCVAHDYRELEDRRRAPLDRPALTDPGRIAVLQPTGGTTGVPKLAMLTHHNLVGNVSQYFTFANRPAGEDSVLAVLPFFHIYGATVVLLGSVAHAAAMVLQARFDVRQMLAACDRFRPTIAPLVPFMYVALIEELKRRRRKIDYFDICSSGASMLEQSIRDEFVALSGVVISEGYGLSECSPVVCANFPGTYKTGTVGLPVPDTIVRIVDVETGEKELPQGEVGEIVVQGPQVMSGYLDNPAETAITLRNGWLYTGDLGSMDADGYFRVVDRKKDMIISGGLNVFPSEVEPVLARFPGIQQVAVVGEPDHKWGERVIAWIVPRPGTQVVLEDLEAHCKHELAPYKVPKDFRVADSLPVSFIGKVQRAQLRQTAKAPAPKSGQT